MLQSNFQEDSYLHKGMRAQLVGKLRDMGIKDDRVLAAINTVPRHFFLDTAFQHIAYENRAFQILAQQTISHPFTVAFQTELLQIKKFDKVLEIGTGSAYQSCILAELGAQVFTVERQRALYDHVGTFSYLKKYPSIKRFYGDGYVGLPSYAPFDKVIVTAGAPFVPDALTQQLKPGGILVIPVGDGNGQRMLRITKEIDHKLKADDLGPFEFVPMLEGKNK